MEINLDIQIASASVDMDIQIVPAAVDLDIEIKEAFTINPPYDLEYGSDSLVE